MDPSPPTPRLGVPVIVVTMATASAALAAQILAHRMISAKLLNNYAFLVISLTMLGFAASGVLLTPRLGRVLADRSEHLARFSALFVLSFVAATAIFYHAPAGSQFIRDRGAFVIAQLSWAPLALLLAVPFTFAGLILGALLADPRLPARRVYGVDLLGSAAGAIVVVPLIRWIGVERGALLVCAVFLATVVAALAPRRPATIGLVVAAGAALAAGFASPARVFPLRVRPGSTLAQPTSASGPGLEYVQWDPVARIEISRIPLQSPETMGYACLIGGNPQFLARFHRVLTQNDYAFAYMVHYDGRHESLRGIEETIYAAAYHVHAAERPRVLTIGVGGGFDVLTALAFEASRVVGVEVNGATLDVVEKVYRDYCREWVQDPRVELVEDDGRRYLAGTGERFDVIQLSGVDSYSGTPAAAHVFSENFLYTAEAFDLYLSRLSEEGILNVMRLEFTPQREMLRALTTAVESLRRGGVAEPHRHVITVSARRNNFTAVLVKKTPFTAEEAARVRRWADGNAYLYVTASPFGPPPPTNMYAHFLGLRTPARERAFMAAYPFQIVPATDDRPFFFNYARWDHLWSRDESVRRSLPAMQITTILLLGVIGVAASACVYLPLRMVEARPRRGQVRGMGLYFAAIGLGYFAVEIAFLQRFGVFLGHPNYALSVVLAVMLLGTGLGALAAAPIIRVARHPRMVAYALAATLLLEHLVLLPLLPRLAGSDLAARVAVSTLLILPVSALLGVFLPVGMERLKATGSGALAPWAWGVNGIFSVLAPVASVAFSIAWGTGALLLAAIPVYLAAGFAFGRDEGRPPE